MWPCYCKKEGMRPPVGRRSERASLDTFAPRRRNRVVGMMPRSLSLPRRDRARAKANEASQLSACVVCTPLIAGRGLWCVLLPSCYREETKLRLRTFHPSSATRPTTCLSGKFTADQSKTYNYTYFTVLIPY